MTDLRALLAPFKERLTTQLPDNARMDAYYYGFSRTNFGHVDAILSAVAVAGKGSHHTESWAGTDSAWFYGDRPGLPSADGAEDLIQRTADLAARNIAADQARLLAAIEAVGGLHQPVTVYEIDPINGTWVYDSETDERKVLTLLCRECTPAFVLDDLDEGEYDGGGSDADVHFPCPTITALAAALGSATTNQEGTQ